MIEIAKDMAKAESLAKTINGIRAGVRGVFEISTLMPDGSKKNVQRFNNGCTIPGLNYLLDTGFGGGTADTTWFIGVINNASFTSLSSSDTLASHAGWTEWSSYSGNRPAWTIAAASAGQVTNSASAASITMTAGGTIRGLFLCGVTSGSSGVLYSTGVLGTGRAVIDTEVLQLVYTSILTPG